MTPTPPTLSTAVAALDARKARWPASYYGVWCHYSGTTRETDWMIVFFRDSKKPNVTVHGATLGAALDKLNGILDEPEISPAEALAAAERALPQ